MKSFLINNFWSVLATVLIFVASTVPVPETDLDGVPLIDKWVHFIMYAGLACAVWFDIYRHRYSRHVGLQELLWTVAFPIIFGGSIELVQRYLTTCRSGEWLDFLADTIGVIAIPIGLTMRLFARRLSWPKPMIISLLVATFPTATCWAQDTTDTPINTPTMGWSSWNTFYANINEDIIKGQADAMVARGFDKVGYQYINIDDGFFANRDENGRLIVHPTRFPNGLKPVVDYIHSKGLKAGIYSDAGYNTCASYFGGEIGGVGAGLYEHDDEDCEMYFDEMEFDFIKVDFCGGSAGHNADHLSLDEKKRYTAISDAIKKVSEKTGRRVVFNACRWAYPGTWIADVADSWRTTGDINASWGSVKGIIEENLCLSAYCHDGHYNDMDMLEVGRGLSAVEDRTHFGMWCIMSSPLLIGCDLRNISAATRALLMNKELIALNQDPLGLQAYVVAADNGKYVLVKDIEERYGLTRAVALYNSTDESASMTLRFEDIELGGNVTMRELITRHDVSGVQTGEFTVSVPAHGTKIYKVTGEKRLMRTRYEAETAYLSAYQEIKNNQAEQSAIYSADKNCSGGMKAGWLGMKAGNDLQWRNVYVKHEGDYDMDIAYICGESRKIIVSVNGEKVSTLACHSGGWDKVAKKTVRIHLNAGENVVRLYTNSSAWMPDIDYMHLTPVVPAAVSAPQASLQGHRSVYDLNGCPVQTQKNASESVSLTDSPRGVYVVDGKKIIK